MRELCLDLGWPHGSSPFFDSDADTVQYQEFALISQFEICVSWAHHHAGTHITNFRSSKVHDTLASNVSYAILQVGDVCSLVGHAGAAVPGELWRVPARCLPYPSAFL